MLGVGRARTTSRTEAGESKDMATDAWGIEDGYWDIRGDWHETPEPMRRQLRIAMGGLGDVEDPPPQTRPVCAGRMSAGRSCTAAPPRPPARARGSS